MASGAVTSGEIGNAAVLSGNIASGQIGQYHFATGLGTKFTVSISTPSSPISGDRWYDTNSGILYTYIDDGNSQQWVQF